jgi:hypothetical protein
MFDVLLVEDVSPVDVVPGANFGCCDVNPFIRCDFVFVGVVDLGRGAWTTCVLLEKLDWGRAGGRLDSNLT